MDMMVQKVDKRQGQVVLEGKEKDRLVENIWIFGGWRGCEGPHDLHVGTWHKGVNIQNVRKSLKACDITDLMVFHCLDMA